MYIADTDNWDCRDDRSVVLQGLISLCSKLLHSEEHLLLDFVCEGAGGADDTDELDDGGGGA